MGGPGHNPGGGGPFSPLAVVNKQGGPQRWVALNFSLFLLLFWSVGVISETAPGVWACFQHAS